MSKRRPRLLSDEIRRAIKATGMTRYGICKATGLDQTNVGRFLRGQVGMQLDTLDHLLDTLDLEVTIAPRSGKRGKQ